jgi:hypothetical protein
MSRDIRIKPMARAKTRPDDSVAARIEQALAITGGRLKLWLVFETDSDVRAARALIAERKARHLTALTHAELERRHGKAYREIAERCGEDVGQDAGHDIETSPPDTAAPPSPARRKKNEAQHSPVA